MTSKALMISRLLPTALGLGAVCLLALSAQAVTTLTIDSLATGETDVIELPDDAKLNIEVTETGIKLVVPNVPIKVKCLALASAPNTCTLLAGSGGSGVDSDSDGVIDSTPDNCPNTPAGSFVDSNGCTDSQRDDDGDGISNGSDSCENTPPSETANASGCSPSQVDGDADEDGVSDSADQCVNQPGPVSNNGCPLPGTDLTGTYCNNPARDNVICSKSTNLDSIYASTAFVDYLIPSAKIASLPFTVEDKSPETDIYGSWNMISPESSLSSGPGEAMLRLWISEVPGGSPLAGARCNRYYLVADANFGWSQFQSTKSCTVGENTTSAVRYLNIAVSCDAETYPTACPESSRYLPHNGYELTLGGTYK